MRARSLYLRVGAGSGAARRAAAARERLVEAVRARLARELARKEAGIDRVITISNLDESLSQLLRATR